MSTNNMEESSTKSMKEEICFLRRVQTAFKDEPHSYRRFIAILWDLKARTTTGHKIGDALADLQDLFGDRHRPLLRDFDAFLPEGYKILGARLPPPTPPPPSPVTLEHVIAFLNTLKTHFRDDEGVYRSFLDAVKRHANDESSVAWPKLAALFRDRHQEVLGPLREIVFGAPPEGKPVGDSKRKRSPEHGEEEERRRRTAECSPEGEVEEGAHLMVSTAEAVERLLEEIPAEGSGGEEVRIELEERFTAQQLRTLEKVYGHERWAALREAFRCDPRWHFGAVLRRLRNMMGEPESKRPRMARMGHHIRGLHRL